MLLVKTDLIREYVGYVAVGRVLSGVEGELGLGLTDSTPTERTSMDQRFGDDRRVISQADASCLA